MSAQGHVFSGDDVVIRFTAASENSGTATLMMALGTVDGNNEIETQSDRESVLPGLDGTLRVAPKESGFLRVVLDLGEGDKGRLQVLSGGAVVFSSDKEVSQSLTWSYTVL